MTAVAGCMQNNWPVILTGPVKRVSLNLQSFCPFSLFLIDIQGYLFSSVGIVNIFSPPLYGESFLPFFYFLDGLEIFFY